MARTESGVTAGRAKNRLAAHGCRLAMARPARPMAASWVRQSGPAPGGGACAGHIPPSSRPTMSPEARHAA